MLVNDQCFFIIFVFDLECLVQLKQILRGRIVLYFEIELILSLGGQGMIGEGYDQRVGVSLGLFSFLDRVSLVLYEKVFWVKVRKEVYN